MLRRFGPFDALDRDFQDVRRLFGEFGSALLDTPTRAWVPPLDLFTRDNQIVVRLELPGVDAENDVDIEFTDGVLTISGERRHEAADQGDGENGNGNGWIRREISVGRFTRSVSLPQHIDASQIRATYDAGILTVTVPMPEKPTSKVKVEVGGSTHKELES
ncbi:MAG TPA: Hsp20/alpha crystallin family protein [Actinomycetota bacterium]|nr:Hsp20/alpha crystallin family protein [Actinomycetota bacterium]